MKMATQPKYQAIIEDILEKIHQDLYPPASLLPSENQMAKAYGVSVPTVRQALQELVHRGRIVRVKGKGTFVNSGELEENGFVGGNGQRSLQIISFLAYSEHSDHSVMRMIRSAQAYLMEKGYSMAVMFGDDNTQSEAELMQKSMELGVAGVLLFSANPNASLDAITQLEQAGIPLVFLDRETDLQPCSVVTSYNVDGAYRMARHHLENGHRRIVYATDTTRLTTERARITGFRLALRQAGVADDEMMILEDVYAKPDILLQHIAAGATAVQCVNDKTALWVIQQLAREGIRVPDQVSVSGFDGTDQGLYSVPHLTTVMQPFEEMGRTAASRLLKLIAGKGGHTQIYLPVELIVKDSTAPLASGSTTPQP